MPVQLHYVQLISDKANAADMRSFDIRFEFESAVRLIRFESDWLIRKFLNRIGRACSFASRKLSQTTQTINGT